MYTGDADWNPVREFKNIVQATFTQTPTHLQPKVFGSGDVKTHYDAFERLVTTGADGIMIGRGSFGNPWIFDKNKVARTIELAKQYGWPKPGNIDDVKELEAIKAELTPEVHSFDTLKEMALYHAKLMEEDKGAGGIIQMRKHLGWYFGGFEGAKALRSALVRVNSIQELEQILNSFEMPETL
jgi:tRNA-dihydrouridine synthase